MEPSRYVIFDLDDTLVHSDAVREAFATVACAAGVEPDVLTRTLDSHPGRPAREIFELLGFARDDAAAATERFIEELDERNRHAPPVAYPDAATTLCELAATGAQLMLSTGSSPERARQVLDQEGWDGFTVVLGSDDTCAKGSGHYEQISAHAPDRGWTRNAVTVGDSPTDMRLAAEHGVPVRIGVDRDGDPHPLFAAGATHVVRALSDILPILAVVSV
ncbi:MAG TPA: HAD hydrolase-like protein [Solirubrobacter sp.]|nr:HAD hydrolase-like protein [Solirubrobacter sp.]